MLTHADEAITFAVCSVFLVIARLRIVSAQFTVTRPALLLIAAVFHS
jgi:hypothetical protein